MADKMSDVVTCKIQLVTSIAIRILHQTNGWKICKIAKKYLKFARRSINRHAKLTTLLMIVNLSTVEKIILAGQE